MVTYFLRGLAASLRRPHFAIAIWLAEAALAGVLLLPIANVFHAAMNHSPQAAATGHSPDFLWWKTLVRTHPDLLGDLPAAAQALVSGKGAPGFFTFENSGALGATFLGLGFFAIILHSFLLGGILGGLRDPEAGRNLATFAREGVRRLPAFLIVTVGAAALCVAAYHYVFYFSGTALAGVSRNFPTERDAIVLAAARVVVFVILLTLIKLCADAIRVALVERPDYPPVTRYLIGVGSALGRLPTCIFLLVSFTFVTGLLYFGWSRLNVNSAAVTTGGVFLLVAAQQVFIFLRAVVKVGYYAGLRQALVRSRQASDTGEPAPAAG